MTNYVLQGRNVNTLWARAVPLIMTIGKPQGSRAGDVLVAPHPVMSVTSIPTERVLFDPARDANPFFHLFESLWMLAGRRDAGFLNIFVKSFGERFAEKNGDLYGAYGYRWRHAWDVDQIEIVVQRLRKNHDDRRVVLTMWNVDDDLLEPDYINTDTNQPYEEPKDLPCNTHIYLRVCRNVIGVGYEETVTLPMLDMTVCCRSNDIVWGAYGANAVHFSFLQEYLAGRIGVEVGTMYQLSNNWHAYRDVLDGYLAKSNEITGLDPYSTMIAQPIPIGNRWQGSTWDDDLRRFLCSPGSRSHPYENEWFANTATPMFRAHAAWSEGDRKKAVQLMDDVAASDWARAGREWMQRRIRKEGGA
jgi:thymidylate synthase